MAAFLIVALGVIAEAIDDGIGITPWALLALGASIVAVHPLVLVVHAKGRALTDVLVRTAALQAAFGALLAIGLWVGRP